MPAPVVDIFEKPARYGVPPLMLPVTLGAVQLEIEAPLCNLNTRPERIIGTVHTEHLQDRAVRAPHPIGPKLDPIGSIDFCGADRNRIVVASVPVNAEPEWSLISTIYASRNAEPFAPQHTAPTLRSELYVRQS